MNTIDHRRKCVDQYKVSNGCCICGYNKHPSAICFDHDNDCNKHQATKNGYSKKSGAGGMYRLYSKKYDIEILIEEIKKCRLLCANCHMENTHNNNIINSTESAMSIEDLKDILKC